MATKRKRHLVSFTPEEHERVKAEAARFRLSLSEYARRLLLGMHLPDPTEFEAAEAIRDLRQVNADQARLGNLLKLTLDEADGQFATPTVARIEDLIAEVRKTQDAIRAKVEDLHFELHPLRRRPS